MTNPVWKIIIGFDNFYFIENIRLLTNFELCITIAA